MQNNDVQTLLMTLEEKRIVFCAYFFEEEQTLYSKIQVFRIYGEHQLDNPIEGYSQYILTDALFTPNVIDEWMNKSTLWFRKGKECPYEAYIEYMDEYRDIFSVNPNHPLMTFVVPL